MSGTSFTQKLLRVSFQTPSGSFTLEINDVPANQLATPLRARALIAQVGVSPTLELQVWGMTSDHMNQASLFGKYGSPAQGYSVTVEAGDSASGFSSIYTGDVTTAWEDPNQQPETFFHVVAYNGKFELLKARPSKSYTGPTSASVIFGAIASDLGLSLEDNGVSGIMLSDPYLAGDASTQLQQAAIAANVNAALDGGVLSVTPTGKSRPFSTEISAATGMIGYPSSTGNGVAVSTLYNPGIKFLGTIQVKSSINKANGTYQVSSVSHLLECNLPGGQWRTNLEAYPQGVTAPAPVQGS